jgi:hypothetical protein
MPTSRRTRAWSATTSSPAMLARPDVGTSVVVRIEAVVVFPAPFGPSRQNSAPAATSNETPSSALPGAPR